MCAATTQVEREKKKEFNLKLINKMCVLDTEDLYLVNY